MWYSGCPTGDVRHRGEKVKKLRELQDELSWLEKDIAHVEGKKRSPPSSEAVQPAALLGLPFARQPSSGLQAQQAQEAQQAQAPRPQLHQQQQHPVKAEEVLAMHPQPPPVAHPQRPSRQPFSDDGNQSGPAGMPAARGHRHVTLMLRHADVIPGNA